VGHIWDDDLAGELETNVRLNDAFGPGKTYGAFTVQTVIGIGLYAGGRMGNKGRLAQTGGDIMRGQILSQVYVQGLKYTVQRERPDKSNHHSFPSGHSASVFATAGVLQRNYGWKVGVPGYAVASYVAASRVHDNRHYLSDVIFGAALGIAAEHTVSVHSRRYAFDVTPTPTPGGAAVMVAVRTR
jgi:membrane-associated phospholipid phosphatase